MCTSFSIPGRFQFPVKISWRKDQSGSEVSVRHPQEKSFIALRKPLIYGRKVQILAVFRNKGKWYVSWCPELDIASQGDTIEEAIENLKEVIELYLEEDAQIPTAGQVFTTTVEVSSHVKTSHPVSS